MAKRKPKHLAVVPESGEKPKVEPAPETRRLPEKAAAQLRQLGMMVQRADHQANEARRRLTEATRLVVAALGIDPDSQTEKWDLDVSTGILTKVLPKKG